MYLSKLVIEGFKSFGEKISINFHKGLTVIAGPNGSGKSNILDAIKWVFGTRSLKELRTDDIKNILFHGVNKNAHFAEVSAILSDENSSAEDVVISRKLYQDGTFEYYLNNQQVRLKDIKEFIAKNASAFLDYSLFEQNNVDSIIKITPQERGKFFEDVAGLSYYRLKYNETLKTLQKVNEKFYPLKKKINELEKEKEILEEEAKQTQEYLSTIEKLKETKKKIIVINYNRIADDIEKHQIKAKQMENEISGLYASFINLSTHSKQIKEKLKDLKTAQGVLNNQILTYINTKDKIYEQLQAKQSEYQNFQKEFNKLLTNYNVLKSESIEIKEKITNLAVEKTQIEADIMSINEYINGVEEIQTNLLNNRKDIQLEVKEAEEKLLGLNWELSNINNELNRIDNELKLEDENLQKTTEKIYNRNDIMKNYKEKLDKLNSEIENLKKTLETEKTAFKLLESEVKILEENKIKKQTTLHFLRSEEEKLKNEQYSMEELIQNDEKELKQYLEQLNKYEEQYTLLFNVLQLGKDTPQELLRFIGIFENAILCRKEIKFLPEITPPTNTFFILPKKIDEEQKVKFLEFLQNNHIICKDERYIENFYAIFYYYLNSTASLFSLNDNIYIKIGNSTPRITNLYYLTAKLSEKIVNLKKQIEDETALLNNYEDRIKNMDESIARKRTIIYEINVELDSKIKEYNNASKEEELLANEIEYLNSTIQLVKNKINNLSENRQNALLRRKNTEELIINIKKTYEQKVILLDGIEKEFQTMSEKMSELKNTRDNYYNKMMNIKSNLTEYNDKLKNIENQLKDIETLKVNNEQLKKQFEEVINNLNRQMEENNLLYQYYSEYNTYLEEIEKKYVNEYEALNSEIEKVKKLYDEKKGTIYQVFFKLQALAEKMDEVKKLSMDEFKEECEKIQQNYNNIEEDVNILKEKIKQYEEKIAGFTNINLNAIDKLNTLQEELQIFQDEYNKLSAIHNELSEFLNNLEKEASCIFENTVNTISESFNKYIRKLFEGGRARLDLTRNGTDYEINLNVQIPNKNVKNLESFSGGERALVSLALLFSILELKPSPFYVLDEIDASLDDNNLSKLLGLLKEFSYNHQILMISHNKHTLNIADYIIGVTIADGSFSKVLGISLEKALSYAS